MIMMTVPKIVKKLALDDRGVKGIERERERERERDFIDWIDDELKLSDEMLTGCLQLSL